MKKEEKSTSLEIQPGKQSVNALNKEQKRFNNLVTKIATLRRDIDQVKEVDLKLRQLGDTLLYPHQLKQNEALRDWLLTLHHHPERQKLSKKLSKKFALLMQEEIAALLNLPGMQEDAEMQTIFCYYEGSGRTFEEVQAEEEMEEKTFAAEMMNMIFDTDLDPDDLDNPEILMEKMKAASSGFEDKRHQAGQFKKGKKSATANAAAEKRREVEDSVKKTAKQIYLDLVRHFHPDKEPDEQKRAEKNEIMQQITAAYKADDHLRLLELQMNLLASRENMFAEFDNAQLKYFNKTLQQQVYALEQEYFFASPGGNGNPYGDFFDLDTARIERDMHRAIKDIKADIKDIANNRAMIMDGQVFRAYIQDFYLDM
jgi:hypothetical protein